MSYKAINNIDAINDTLENPTSTKEFPLGTPLHINDTSKGGESVFLYTKSHASLSLGQPLELQEGSGGGAELITVSIATFGDGQGALIGFPLTDVTSGHYFWAQVSGVITAKAGTVTAGDKVEVLNGGTTVVEDEETDRNAHTLGIAKTSTSGGFADIVVMPNRRVHIAAT